MEIKVAKNAGFCFGVRRAIDRAIKVAKLSPVNIYTLGPIIHNPQVVSKLEQEGVMVANDLSDIESRVMIIRTHGITIEKMSEAKKKKFKIIEATCPFVKRSQLLVDELRKEGYKIVIVGEKEHPEIISLLSYARGTAVAIKTEEEAQELPFTKRIGIISQTTQSPENFRTIVSKLLEKGVEFKIHNTICPDTAQRQSEAASLAKEVDLVLVIGGKNSANTTRLFSISKKIQPRAYHVETPDEIMEDWFRGVKTIGITAGASTPDWIIDDVAKKLKEF